VKHEQNAVHGHRRLEIREQLVSEFLEDAAGRYPGRLRKGK
jgi:hypothetical protein